MTFTSCKSQSKAKTYEIDKESLLYNLKTISSDAYEGRGFGTKGNRKAQEFMAAKFKELNIAPGFESGYIQEFKHTIAGKRRLRMFPLKGDVSKDATIPDTTLVGGNVVARIAGKTEKTIVITGHIDHLGIRNGEIYNGADDDASGTVALLAIAAYFKDKTPEHSLVLAAVDAEEIGSHGCQYLLDNFPGGKEHVVLNINMDMIAHNDSLELYASGLYHYPQFRAPLDAIASPIKLLYGHDDPNDKDLDDWTFASDHRIFHKQKIPFIYFGVEDHKDYHKPSDIFENINQDFYVEAVKLIIQAIENSDNFLSID